MPHPVMNANKPCSRTKSTGHIIPFAAIAASAAVLLPLLFLPVSADSGIKGSLDTIRNMITDILKMGSNEEVAKVLSSGVTAPADRSWTILLLPFRLRSRILPGKAWRKCSGLCERCSL